MKKATSFHLMQALVWNRNYSYRRYCVDQFYLDISGQLHQDHICIDVGGKRERKKGRFILEDYVAKPIYVNISEQAKPDYICDAKEMPFPDNYGDVIICSEMLEHTLYATETLAEVHRVLKPGGRAYICVPFSMHIHDVPHDYARYTKSWWEHTANATGFTVCQIQEQGGYYATKVNMNKRFYKIYRRHHKYGLRLLAYVSTCLSNVCLLLMEGHGCEDVEIGYTTGYGMILEKTRLT